MTQFDAIQQNPTTHVLVDDSRNYLRNLSMLLPSEREIYKYFTDPKEALSWVNSSFNEPNEIISKGAQREANQRDLSVVVGDIHKAIYSAQRFNKISTIIVDYEMPGMSGLEFCKSIDNPHIKKILLTGYLSDKDARHARNKGWIDMFLSKGEDTAEKMAELIYDADSKYFEESNLLLKSMVDSYGGSYFLKLTKVKEFFQMVYEEFNAVEYYLLNPDGDYLFVDALGNTCGLSIQSKERREGRMSQALDCIGVTDDIFTQLNKSGIFCHNDDQEPSQANEWKAHIYPAITVDKNADIMGAYGPHIFASKAKNIKSFKSAYDQSIRDAMKVLND